VQIFVIFVSRILGIVYVIFLGELLLHHPNDEAQGVPHTKLLSDKVAQLTIYFFDMTKIAV